MKLVKLSILTACLIANSSAFAAPGAGVGSGNITISGLIQATSCQIDTTIQPSEDITVTLPTLASSAFTAADQVRGTKEFILALTNCPTGSVAGHFETVGGSGFDSTTGNLEIVSGGTGNADKIQIRLFDSDGVTQIRPGNSGTKQTIASDTDKIRLHFYAGYYSTDAKVTAGKVSANVIYSLDYS